MLVIFNFTGRIFLCTKNSDGLIDDENYAFTPGELYREAIIDHEGNKIMAQHSDDVYLLYNDDNIIQYVEAEGFELTERTVENLDLLWFCAN